MKEKHLNYEEFMQMIEECYEAFGDVLKICDIDKKRAAIEGIKTLEQIVKEHVSNSSEGQGIDFHQMHQFLKNTDYALFKEGKDAKQRFEEIKSNLEPLIQGFTDQIEKEKPQKKRKKKMENKIKSRE